MWNTCFESILYSWISLSSNYPEESKYRSQIWGVEKGEKGEGVYLVFIDFPNLSLRNDVLYWCFISFFKFNSIVDTISQFLAQKLVEKRRIQVSLAGKKPWRPVLDWGRSMEKILKCYARSIEKTSLAWHGTLKKLTGFARRLKKSW